MATPAKTLLQFTASQGNTIGTQTEAVECFCGGSSPEEQVSIIQLPGGRPNLVDAVDFMGILPRAYAGAGITVYVHWSASDATTGNVRLGAAFRRIADDGEDVSAAHTYDYNYATDATANVKNEVAYTAIAFTHGADMDSLAVGESFILRIKRDMTSAADTMLGQLRLIAVEVSETEVP